MFNSIGLPELLIVLALLVIVLGPKRIPRTARSLGSSVKNFKASFNKNEPPEELPARAGTEPETLDGEVVRDTPRR